MVQDRRQKRRRTRQWLRAVDYYATENTLIDQLIEQDEDGLRRSMASRLQEDENE